MPALLRRFFIAVLMASVTSASAYCQVINDSIKHRIQLKLNRPVRSNTIKSTIEWNCINAALTGKCIKYHNDQWFFVEVDSVGDYFLNISDQHCRDVNGIQVVVIEGAPCEIETYRILTCYSTGTQDDVFIELKSLEPATQYLVSIDGYLHDYCQFKIELSDVPKGLPVIKEQESNARFNLNNNNVHLKWDMAEESTVETFQVWKRVPQDKRHQLIAVIPVVRNTIGQPIRSYEYEDSLFFESPSNYKIVGSSELSTILIDELVVRRDSIVIDQTKENKIDIDLDYKQGTPLTILIFDSEREKLLQNVQVIFDKRRHQKVSYYIEDHRLKGTTHFRVEVIDAKTKQKRIVNFNRQEAK